MIVTRPLSWAGESRTKKKCGHVFRARSRSRERERRKLPGAFPFAAVPFCKQIYGVGFGPPFLRCIGLGLFDQPFYQTTFFSRAEGPLPKCSKMLCEACTKNRTEMSTVCLLLSPSTIPLPPPSYPMKRTDPPSYSWH